jgi:hypothetical protein
MKQKIFFSLVALAAVFMLVQTATVEARCHHHHHRGRSTSVQFNLGTVVPRNDTVIVHRYPRVIPAQAVVAAPVVVPAQPVVAAPGYCAPVVVYPAPAYVEEVYVAPAPAPCPFTFGGLSFSWNFFR